jgi:RAD51-like protein 2
MSGREVSTLDLAPSICDMLLRSGFCIVDDIVCLKPYELAKELSVTPTEAANILKAVNNVNNPPELHVSALELCRKANTQRPIITFCKALDNLLGGGVQIGQLTEFCGVPGIGKTQLGIQLSLCAQIPEAFTGNGGESIYIDTEGSFMVERVAEMAQALSDHLNKIASRAATHPTPGADMNNIRATAVNVTVERLLQGIHVFRAHNQVEQMSIINSLGAFMKTHTNIKLIVVDSVAFHFRQDLQEVGSRSRILSSLAQTLNQLAFDHSLAVVSINHITTRVSSGGAPGSGSVSRIVPALGEQWSHCIANRVMMFWQQSRIRTACLVKSPSRPQGVAQFTINKKGIRDETGVGVGVGVVRAGGQAAPDGRSDEAAKKQRL